MTTFDPSTVGDGTPVLDHVPLRRVLTDTAVIARRNFLRFVRLPQLLVFSTIQPVMFLLLFTYVFGGAIGQVLPGGFAYLDFLLPGLLIQVTVFGSGSTAIGLTEDLDKGVVDRFRSLPMSRAAVLTGRTLADVARNGAVMTLMVVVASLLGFRAHTSIGGFLAGGALALAFSYALSWLMATIGLLVRNPEATQSAVFLPVFPLVFASSVFLPTQTMPSWLQAFADNQPITAVANAVRGLMLGQDALLGARSVTEWVVRALLWIAAITVVFSWAAVRAYRRIDT